MYAYVYCSLQCLFFFVFPVNECPLSLNRTEFGMSWKHKLDGKNVSKVFYLAFSPEVNEKLNELYDNLLSSRETKAGKQMNGGEENVNAHKHTYVLIVFT